MDPSRHILDAPGRARATAPRHGVVCFLWQRHEALRIPACETTHSGSVSRAASIHLIGASSAAGSQASTSEQLPAGIEAHLTALFT